MPLLHSPAAAVAQGCCCYCCQETQGQPLPGDENVLTSSVLLVRTRSAIAWVCLMSPRPPELLGAAAVGAAAWWLSSCFDLSRGQAWLLLDDDVLVCALLDCGNLHLFFLLDLGCNGSTLVTEEVACLEHSQFLHVACKSAMKFFDQQSVNSTCVVVGCYGNGKSTAPTIIWYAPVHGLQALPQWPGPARAFPKGLKRQECKLKNCILLAFWLHSCIVS